MAYFFTFNNYLLENNFYSILEITNNKYRIAIQNSSSIRIIQVIDFFACKEVILTKIGDNFTHFFHCVIVTKVIKDLSKAQLLRMLPNQVA